MLYRRFKIAITIFFLSSLMLPFQNCSNGFNTLLMSQLGGSQLWSDPTTWGGTLPKAGQAIVIAEGQTVILDVSPPELSSITIDGELIFDNQDLNLTVGMININSTGTLQIGDDSMPFDKKATINLSGDPSVNPGARGIFVNGGNLLLYGKSTAVAWTQLNAHANAGATSLTLKDSVDWRPDDNIVIAPTDWFNIGGTELLQISRVGDNVVQLKNPLSEFRWGLLQYVTGNGMSLTPDPSFVPPEEPFPRILDQRAEVGNLSRSIVIQSVDDSHWQTKGLGAHIMIMDISSVAQIDGVELRRVGQSGVLARYPVHWHMLSYNPTTGALIGDAVGSYLKNSTIWNSKNRCVVIHGTNGLVIENNICYDIRGHAFFLEDAVERRNKFTKNLALKIRDPEPSKLLLNHESSIRQIGSSGFWLTNPDNELTQNVAADANGVGFWLAFPEMTLGQSKAVALKPNNIPPGKFDYNISHSNNNSGIMLELPPIDDAGNVTNKKYIPTTDGSPGNYQNHIKFTLKGQTVYKNMQGAYRNRTTKPEYLEWVSADNRGRTFVGQVDDAQLKRHLVVGTSLNNLSPYPNVWPYDPPSAFASYHSTLNFINNVVVNFPLVGTTQGGTFGTDDYYIGAVDRGPVRNSGNLLINSHPGPRILPVEYRNPPVAGQYWTLAGALWDPHGYWGQKGNYWVYDMPFLTAGANCVDVAPAGTTGKSCDGEYLSVGSFLTDFDSKPYVFSSPLHVTRLNPDGSEIGTWQVGDGALSSMLGNMRHFAARRNAEYIMRFPNRPILKMIAMDVSNASTTDDTFIIGIDYDGKDSPVAYTVSNYNRFDQYTPAPGTPPRRDMTSASNLDEVRSSDGNKYWIDRSRSLIWIKYKGGLPLRGTFIPLTDNDLYRTHSVVIDGR